MQAGAGFVRLGRSVKRYSRSEPRDAGMPSAAAEAAGSAPGRASAEPPEEPHGAPQRCEQADEGADHRRGRNPPDGVTLVAQALELRLVERAVADADDSKDDPLARALPEVGAPLEVHLHGGRRGDGARWRRRRGGP